MKREQELTDVEIFFTLLSAIVWGLACRVVDNYLRVRNFPKARVIKE